MPFDFETLRVGAEVLVIEGLYTAMRQNLAGYAVSDSGSLIYLSGARENESWLVRLTPGEGGSGSGTAGGTSAAELPATSLRLHDQPVDFQYGGIDLSPDGRRLARRAGAVRADSLSRVTASG